MVMTIRRTHPCNRASTQTPESYQRHVLRHTGQDSLLHGRLTGDATEDQLPRRKVNSISGLDDDLITIFSIDVDEKLLTGDLDQDISILNTVT